MLKSKLYQIELEKVNKEKDERDSKKLKIDFGSQIRNYVLHPYKMITIIIFLTGLITFGSKWIIVDDDCFVSHIPDCPDSVYATIIKFYSLPYPNRSGPYYDNSLSSILFILGSQIYPLICIPSLVSGVVIGSHCSEFGST